jgi:TonB family protein
MSIRGLICVLTMGLLWSTGARAQGVDEVFLAYARSARPEVKLVRFITEFPGTFPAQLMRACEVTLVFQRKGTANVITASRPALDRALLDSLSEWLVPFNPMSVDTFAVALKVQPLRQAILSRSKYLGSPHARLVSTRPWYRKGIQVRDTAGGKPRPGVNRFNTSYYEPSFDPDTLGSYILFPAVARQRGLSGTVMIAALVSANGIVQDLVILESDNVAFDEAAARAIRCLRFTPGLLNRVPTTMWVRVPISFKAD